MRLGWHVIRKGKGSKFLPADRGVGLRTLKDMGVDGFSGKVREVRPSCPKRSARRSVTRGRSSGTLWKTQLTWNTPETQMCNLKGGCHLRRRELRGYAQTL